MQPATLNTESRYISTLTDLLEATRVHISQVRPSDWYEQRMVMPSGTAFPGPFSYKLTPYWEEVVNCADKNHPAREITIMAGAQGGKTIGVLNPVIGYHMAINPANMMFLTGHSDLSDASMAKLDLMIDATGLRPKIMASAMRKRNARTGDTIKSKEFASGFLKMGSVTNHNLLRQHDIMVMIVDDFDAAPMLSKRSGSTRELVQKRTAAFNHKRKIFYCSSPEIKGQSNIEAVFDLSDKRYYNVPCPLCGAMIVLKWRIELDGHDVAGMTWRVDEAGHVVEDSVGYICQACGGFFNETHKYEMNLAGQWRPTVTALEQDHYGYQISSLYAPPGMADWPFYVRKWVLANPAEGRKEDLIQTFVNTTLGECYEAPGENISANTLMLQKRPYEIGVVPERLSMDDGNGEIILLTCAADMNGLAADGKGQPFDDARLDWEIVAWADNGASYSIAHGSIGTFQPRMGKDRFKDDRQPWSYQRGAQFSVWPEFERIISQQFEVDGSLVRISNADATVSSFETRTSENARPRKMRILLTGLDCGYKSDLAYDFLDHTNAWVVGLKGYGLEKKYTQFSADKKTFWPAKERTALYRLEVNLLKDQFAELTRLRWDRNMDDSQPAGYLNFPISANGLYEYENYFKHFEAESRDVIPGKGWRWAKKDSVVQNHLFDCRIYNMAIRNIVVDTVTAEEGIKNGTWQEFVNIITRK